MLSKYRQYLYFCLCLHEIEDGIRFLCFPHILFTICLQWMQNLICAYRSFIIFTRAHLCSPLNYPPYQRAEHDLNKWSSVWQCLMWRLQASLSFKNRACQLGDCSPCVSHKGTKDSATVTDWMLHTALVSLSKRVHVCVCACVHISFCTSGSFVLSFHP